MAIAPTIVEAIGLYESVPSIVTTAGDVAIKTRAVAVEIVRQIDDSWRVYYPQEKRITLPDGEIVAKSMAPIRNLKSEDLISETVTIDGQEWPVALAFAIINAVYVREAAKG